MTEEAEVFVSHSGNFEDVLLRRIFHRRDRGFYVDVGAAHPVFENDMKALHDRGWRGVNIEPNAEFLEALRRLRPEDVTLGCALADAPGERAFFEVPGTGLSTLDGSNADRAAQAGFAVNERRVEIRTLAQVLEEAGAPAEFEILKVDVEGAERAVLSGNDWTRFRPNVVIAEATIPNTPIRRDDGVREMMAGFGWRFVWFDGLNDWFLAPGFEPPAGAFDAPPNVFDRFISRQTADAVADAENLRASRDQAIAHLNNVVADRERAIAHLQPALAARGAELAAARAEAARKPSAPEAVGARDPELRREDLQARARLRRSEEALRLCEEAVAGLQAALVASRRELAAALQARSAIPETDPEGLARLARERGERIEQLHERIGQLEHQAAIAHEVFMRTEQDRTARIGQLDQQLRDALGRMEREGAERQRLMRAEQEAAARASQLERDLAAAREASSSVERDRADRLAVLGQQLAAADQALREVYASTSWRASRPIRLLGRVLRRR